ncbi:hypothetical protein VN12_17935 [Pirellula sp. SH-Sr6A]|nr:hypothetical protein VN12_17935 [Pirellula sp. SH-Sr6A]
MTLSSASAERTPTAIFFCATTYFVHFLSLGFSSFPLQTHLRTQLSPATASVLAGLIPIAACTTYFLFRFAESKGWMHQPQRALFVAAIGVAMMQGMLGFRLEAIAEGSAFFGPAIDVALCLLLLGAAQSSVMTLLNHIGVATMGSLAYTVRAAGSAGYMFALMVMGAISAEWFVVEKHHLYVGSVVSAMHCLLAAGAWWLVPIAENEPAPPTASATGPVTSSLSWEWIGLLALVWLVAICEMSYGLYSHEFLTKTFGGLGYFVFAGAVAIEIALLMAMPLFPRLKSRLLFVGPLGWMILFAGCVTAMTGIPALGWCGLFLALNCPFQISANEHAHRMRPSVMGVASMTLAQSLGYITAAGLASGIAKGSEGFLREIGWSVPGMPAPLWATVFLSAAAALALALRKLARQNTSLDIHDFGQASCVAGSGAVASIQEGTNDFEGDFRPDDASTDAQDVHVVVLDPLAGRVSVMAEASPDAGEFVGRYTYTDSRAANQDPSIDLARDHFGSDRLGEVREIA